MERQQSSSSPIEVPKIPEKKTTLVSLNAEYQRVAAELMELGGELTPEVEARLDAACAALCEKADGYGAVEATLKTGFQFWKEQETACYEEKKKFERAIDKLKNRMKYVLRQLPGRTLQGALYRYTLSVRPAEPTVDMDLLPNEYKRVEAITVYDMKPDMEKIKAALAEKKEIPGVKVPEIESLLAGRPKEKR